LEPDGEEPAPNLKRTSNASSEIIAEQDYIHVDGNAGAKLPSKNLRRSKADVYDEGIRGTITQLPTEEVPRSGRRKILSLSTDNGESFNSGPLLVVPGTNGPLSPGLAPLIDKTTITAEPIAEFDGPLPIPKKRGRKKKIIHESGSTGSLANSIEFSSEFTMSTATTDPEKESLMLSSALVKLEDDPEWRPRSLTLRAKSGVFVRPEYGCYCNTTVPSVGEKGDLVCDGCNRVFHQDCVSLILDVPPLPGDVCHEFLCRYCVKKRGGGDNEQFAPIAKSWLDVAEIALYNLTREHSTAHFKAHRRTSFTVLDDLVPFAENHWYSLCYGLEKSRNLENQLRSTLQSNPNFFTMKDSIDGTEKWSLVNTTCPIFLDKTRLNRESISITEYETMRTEEMQAILQKRYLKDERKRRKKEEKDLAKNQANVLGISGIKDVAAAEVDQTLGSDFIGPYVPSSNPRVPGQVGVDGAVYEEPTFEVERIIGKRFDAYGRVQYRIKWVGFDNRYNSWVAPENMDAEEKIKEYESQLALSDGVSPVLTASIGHGSLDIRAEKKKFTLFDGLNKDEDSGPLASSGMVESEALFSSGLASPSGRFLSRSRRYYDRGDTVKRVVGMNKVEGQYAISVEWIGHRKRSWMLSSTLAEKDPLLLIRYYESKLKFQMEKAIDQNK